MKQSSSILTSDLTQDQSDDEEEENLHNSDHTTGDVGQETSKPSQQFDKREKNIRRRVYDALNVQFAAGVLVKNGKYIKPNEKSKEFKRIYQNL